MIKIDFPLFKIPEANKFNAKKQWRWSKPTLFCEEREFWELKRQRVANIDSMLNIANRSNPFNERLWDRAFFEMKFHPKALSKSAQPKKLLEKYNIDAYAHKKEGVFYASSTIKNLTEFRNWISKLSGSENDWALLSAIINISPIKKEEIWLTANLEQEKVFIYLPDTISEREWKQLYEDAIKKYHIKTESEYFISNSNAKIIYGCFPSNFLNDISEELRWPAQKIEKVYDLQVSKSEASTYDFLNIQIEEPLLDAFVVVVDSWIEKHDFMKSLIVAETSIVQQKYSERYHWTMVWSRILFGHYILEDLKKNAKLTAETKLVDLHVVWKDPATSECSVNPKDLIEAIGSLLEKTNEIYKVYNISLNLPHPCDPSNGRDYLTRELDALSHKYKVLFVVSAGNHSISNTKPYPECLEDTDAKIATPADWVNVLSVGSIADNESLKSLAKDNEPSPFTRTWFPLTWKPDIVHYGWNLDRNWRASWLWVLWFGEYPNKIIEDVGTSFSAPLVSQISSKVYAYLKTAWFGDNPPIELVKALVIHSANYNLPNSSVINHAFLHQYVGHGIPDFMRAVNSLKSSATFIYTWIMWELQRNGDKEQAIDKHKILIDVPEELEGKKKMVRVKGTLCYLAPVSPSGELDYSLSDISLNIHYLNSKWTRDNWKLTQWEKNFREDRNTVKTFEKTYTAYKWWQREVRLELLVRWLLDSKDFQQPYALVLSLEDVSEWVQIDLHEIIRTKYQQYIPLVQEIRTQQKIR